MTSTGGVARTRRQRSAFAIKAAAKQRRQRNIAIALAVVFVAIAIYEVPHTIHLLTKHDETASTPLPVTTTPSEPKPSPTKVKLPTSAGDPFAVRSLGGGDSTVGAAIGGHDPFQAPASASVAAAPQAAQPLPQTIVVGTPGAGRTAVHGWIVILASIPTGEGASAASSFAQRASPKVGSLSILNSSNRRPLRGGYWVVYAGPYSTLAAVTDRANHVHSLGYGTAYIRQLIIYK
jgi:hypothetical protein